MDRYEIVWRRSNVYGNNTAHAVVCVICREGKLETRAHGWATAACPVLANCLALLDAIGKFEGQPQVSFANENGNDQRRVCAMFRGKKRELCVFNGAQPDSDAVAEAVKALIDIINEPWKEVEHAAAK